MKTVYALIFLLFTHFSHAQLIETFSDGDFTNNPAWQGDISFFKVTNSNLLQSQGLPASGSLQLFTASQQFISTQWEILIRMDFEPSTTNHCKVYLASDQPDLKGSLNGYYLKIGGESGTSDKIELYRQNGTYSSKLISGKAGNAGRPFNNIRIQVTRDYTGNWSLFSDTSGAQNFLLEGTALDSTFTTCSYFGFVCTHTSTRKDQFFFDDISIGPVPFYPSSADAVSKNQIKLNFSKPLEKLSAQNPNHYYLQSFGQPTHALQILPHSVELSFSQEISKGTKKISCHSIVASDSSILSDSSLSFLFEPPLNYADLLITEIYPDPTPSNGLPEEEFIEIYNISSDTVDITGFSLSDPSISSYISAGKMAPGNYLILCPSVALSSYKTYGPAIAVNPWPSLNNSGDGIRIKDKNGRLLFEVNYSDKWYSDEEKKEGGWSLEMINFEDHCSSSDWRACEIPEGATPGKQNSVFSTLNDSLPPSIISWDFEDSLQIIMHWNEELDTLSKPIIYCGNVPVPHSFLSKDHIILTFSSQPEEAGLTIQNIKDCKGNQAALMETPLIFPQKANPSDILINEILFNPRANGVDFVEIYNQSLKTIDLKNWSVRSLKNGDTLNCIPFSSSFLLPPKSYLVFSPSASILESQYYLPYGEKIKEIPDFPGFNDDQGTVILINSSGQTIDRFDYQENLHLELLQDKEGISLERISFAAPSNEAANWHSAAASAGWATPGYENSQHIENPFKGQFQVEPKIITPDQDGKKDFALIHYNFDSPGYLCNVSVFDTGGRKIASLAQNHLAGKEGFFEWEGIGLNGEIAPPGLYIIVLEAYNSNGNSRGWKGTVIVSQKF